MQTRYGFNMETKSDSKVQCLYVFFYFSVAVNQTICNNVYKFLSLSSKQILIL